MYFRFQQQPIRDEIDTQPVCEEQASMLSMKAEDTELINVPFPILKDMFDKAGQLVSDKCSIVPVPGCRDGRSFLVANVTNVNAPHFLKYAASTLNISCDNKCSRWNSFKLCGHTLALAENIGVLPDYIRKYRLKSNTASNLTAMANTNMPSSRGKKPTKATQKRKGKANSTPLELLQYEDTSDCQSSMVSKDKSAPTDRSYEAPHQNDQPFHLTFMTGIIKKCYGCGQMFPAKQRLPPNDLVLKRFDHRVYVSPRSKVQKKTQNLQSTYYHLNVNCARRKCPRFSMKDVIIQDEVQEQLTEAHKRVLKNLNVVVV